MTTTPGTATEPCVREETTTTSNRSPASVHPPTIVTTTTAAASAAADVVPSNVLVNESQQPTPRKRSDRDQFSLALDPTPSSAGGGSSSSSSSSSASTSRGGVNGGGSGHKGGVRRPSSVFEHVGGMLDRFGRRLHSRSEARGSAGESNRRTSSSALSLVPPDTAAAAADYSEAVSLDEELSPGGSSGVSHVALSQESWRPRKPSEGSTSAEALTAPGRSPIISEHHAQPIQFYAAHAGTSSSTMAHNRSSTSLAANAANDSDNTLRPTPNNLNPGSSSTLSRRVSVIDRVLIQVTEDNERFSVVDISGLNSAAAVKERMLSKLHLFDEDPGSFALSRTEIGAVGSTGPKLDDDELLAMCWEYGDEKGSLKFLLHQIAPPSTSAHAMMPPPMHHQLSPRIAMREVDNGSSTANTATTPTSYSQQEYSKTPSASSRSSVGDHQGAYIDNGEGSSDGGARTHTSGSFARTKVSPVQRRNNANSQSMIEGSRQYSFSGSDASYTSLTHGNADRIREATGIEEMNDGQEGTDTRYDHVRRPGLRVVGTQSRHSAPGQGQWDVDGSTSSSTASTRTALGPAAEYIGSDTRSRPPSYRTTSHPPPLTNKPNSPPSAGTTSPSSSAGGATLPRSLLAGGIRDAAHMYAPSQEGGYEARPSEQRPDPTQRSHSANMFARRPSTSDARMEMRPFSGSSAGGQAQSSVSQSASAIGLTSPISPLTRPQDRERSSSFGGSQIYSAQGHPQPLHQASMHDLRATNAARSQQHQQGGGVPMPRPFVPPRQPSVPSSGQHSHMPSYGNIPPARPPHSAAPHGQFVDRRYMGPAPLPSGMSGVGRPPMQEFGHRNHPYDPRVGYTNIRPPTSSYDRIRYPSSSAGHREEGYMSNYYPASNSRLVSEFQRTASSAHSTLQPGMTVQESLQQQQQQQQQQHHHRPSMNQHATIGPHFRPPSTLAQHSGPGHGRVMRSESMTSSMPSGHATHMSGVGVHGPRDARPPPLPTQIRVPSTSRPPAEHRNDSGKHSVSPEQQMPASMKYYYNPATPTAPSVRVQPSLASPPQHQRAQEAALQSPQRVIGQSNTGKASERSSGSSFNTSYSSSHARVPSGGEGRRRDGEHSAPTSARSSRTSRSMSPKPEEAIGDSSELPYATGVTDLAREGSLKEEDLLKIRPLPRLPPIQTSSGSFDVNQESKDGDTFKAEQWKLIARNAADDQIQDDDDDDDDGTARAESKKNAHLAEMSAYEIANGKVATQDIFSPQDESEGTFKTFDDDDDEDDEGGTWAQPLDTARQNASDTGHAPVRSEIQRGVSPRPEEATLKTLLKPLQAPSSPASNSQSPRRPVLTLNIDQPQVGSPRLLEEHDLANLTLEDTGSSSSHHPSASTPSSSTNLGRSLSFARRERGDWAFRPPPAQLYENLDDFFPTHDLDRPVIDPVTGLAPNSPQAGSPRPSDVSPMTAVVSPSAVANAAGAGALGGRSRMQHKKSIRIVAQDRKRFLERAEAAEKRKTGGVASSVSSANGDLARRRSTKLWGGKVIEVTPGAETASATSDSPTSTTSAESKPVFKWVKGDLIGKGTYGRVYLALNATTGEMIAVKQVEMPTTDSDREDARQKSVVTALKSEIETLKDLDHPNIVSYLGFEETRTNLSIFLEYVPGGSVGSCLRKHGKLDEATIKSFLQQILNGLNYLHGRGILHRDLKADNLLVDYDGIVKISDFGTVRKSEDIYGNVASMSMQGSIFWMAPEVVSLSRAGYSAKVDIWSLGCVVLEMFAGRRPWSDEEAVQAMFKIGAERRAPPIPPDVRLSKAAAHFLKTCFAVDPNERPTAARLLDHVFPHAEPGWRFAMSDLYKQLHR